ncbi:related to phospholipid-translocating ATPase [Cephalotrichum gorgonifer]|uniref:Related to phospholipid-translocating ATPase n=1 Tax=Cephalotrichum gorgonifer TaxID=2041049 RepID=A0AAE8MTP9_9PEZI|nr:related to phospholipid-translocating ATPase [Cephalotrichum gorgonifer]
MSTPTPTIGDSPTGTATTTSTATCVTAVPGKYGEVPIDACNSNWAFHPSFGGNLAWAVLMGLTTCIHLLQAILYKKKYAWVIIMGAAWETGSFALRTVGSRHQQVLAYNVVSTVLLLLAPLWINAFVYMTISRLIHFVHVDQKVMRLRAALLTKVFVWLDVVCFLVQGSGGSLLASDDHKIADIGKKIYIAGIAVQAAIIIVFGGLTAQFYRELDSKGRMDRPVKMTKWLVIVLFANLVLIMFIPGANSDNPLLTNEIYVYCLDALPVLIGLLLLNVLHPGMVLRGPDSEFPRVSRAEKKEMKRAKKEAKMRKKKVGRGEWVEVDNSELASLDPRTEYQRYSSPEPVRN